MKPYAIMLGGRHSGANIEVHDLVFVLAVSKEDAFIKAKKKWFGDPKKVHCDSFIELKFVEGYKFSLEKNANGLRMYAINIGGYLPDTFGEFHEYHFLIAKDSRDAISKARGLTDDKYLLQHVDNKLLVDDLIEVTDIEENQLYWLPTSEKTIAFPTSGYFPFKKREEEG